MFQRFSAVFFFTSLLTGLVWWSNQLQPSSALVNPQFPPQGPKLTETSLTPASARQELMETLDRLVTAENQYRNEHGHYTRIMAHLGFTIPASLQGRYAFHIEEASKSRVLIEAISEKDGQTEEYAAIDQDYQVRSNFTLPSPRIDFLRNVALGQLRKFSESPNEHPKERGIYRDYFRYETRGQGQKTYTVAVGVKAPVLGLELSSNALLDEADESKRILAELINRFPQPNLGHLNQKNRVIAGELEVEPIR